MENPCLCKIFFSRDLPAAFSFLVVGEGDFTPRIAYGNNVQSKNDAEKSACSSDYLRERVGSRHAACHGIQGA